MNFRDFILFHLNMTSREFLLHLRMFEVALLLGCFYWILFHAPVSRTRTIRLWLTCLFGLINLVAIMVVTGAGGELW